MHRLLSHDLWETLRALSSESEKKWAAVSYVTSDRNVAFGKGDVVVVDASDTAIVQGHTDASVLDQAFRRGAKLYSYPRLHSKLMVLSGHAVVGSANISASSADDLVEAALVTDHPSLVGEAIAIISELSQQGDRIDASFLSVIKIIQSAPIRIIDRVSLPQRCHLSIGVPIVQGLALRREAGGLGSGSTRGTAPPAFALAPPGLGEGDARAKAGGAKGQPLWAVKEIRADSAIQESRSPAPACAVPTDRIRHRRAPHSLTATLANDRSVPSQLPIGNGNGRPPSIPELPTSRRAAKPTCSLQGLQCFAQALVLDTK